MDAKITAAGFDDGTGSIATHHGGPNPGSGSVLNRRPMDRRPSLGDSSLHTLNLEGLSDSSSDDSGGEGSDSGSEASSGSGSNDEKVTKKVERKGGWLSNLLKRNKDKKKDEEVGPSSSESLSSAGGGGRRKVHHQGSLSSLARRASDGDETDDLVRPYHRAFHTKERPSFLRRSPMGALRIMGSDEMYHDAKSKTSSSASGNIDNMLSSSSGDPSSSSSSSDMNLSKFSSSYQQHMTSKTSDRDANKEDDEFNLMVVKTQRRRRFLPVLTVSLLVLTALAASAYLLLFQSDEYRRAALRSSAQSFFTRSRETTETTDTPPLHLSSSSPQLENCILNGHFTAQPPTSHWYGVRSDVSPASSYDHALLASDRTHARIGGMWQNLNSNCLVPDTWYQVQANVLLFQAGSGSSNTEDILDCDPSIPWFTHELSCPSIAIKINDSHDIKDVAHTVGPLQTSEDKWYRLYGVFKPTQEMLLQDQIAVIVARAPVNVDIVVDEVRIDVANEYTVGVISNDCVAPTTNLIVNGNAETGDYRYWWIRGNGGDSGHIEIIDTKTEERGYVFKHAGYRAERWRGMLQNLVDTTCLTPGSTWRLSALFRYFETTQEGIEEPRVCDLSNPLVSHSCPVFEMQFFSSDGSGGTINTGPLINEDAAAAAAAEFVVGGWNRIVHTIVISKEMARSNNVWVYVQSVERGFGYELDEVEMVPVVG